MEAAIITTCLGTNKCQMCHIWKHLRKCKEAVIACFVELINELLKTNRIKNWFRAYFNYGLINYINGKPRLLGCGAGNDMFFLDPFGEIRPCNGMDSGALENSMGNLKEQSFDEIWAGAKAQKIRESLQNCPKNCWMIGTASPAIKKNMITPILWVIGNKTRNMLGKRFSLI